MRKKLGNFATAMTILLAISGLGISTGINSIDIRAEVGTASDANSEENTVPVKEFQVNKKLPQGFSVSGLSDTGTYDALNNALEGLQSKINERKFVLDVNGEHIEGSYAELGASIENKAYILSEAEKFSSGNMIERFMKSSQLESTPESITPNIVFDEGALDAFFNNINAKNPNAPVNATIRRVNGVFEITDEREGYAVDREKTVAQIKDGLLSGEDTDIKAELSKQEPAVKAEDLREIQDVLGSFTTNYSSSSSDRATNIAVGTAKMDGVLLMPGETISGYERMHPFTVSNGYKVAKAYQDGLVVDSVGGGACQIATTLYEAALRAEITITQRQNHSMIVNYVQPSGDAAIAGEYKDIKVTNNRSTPIYIEATTAGRNVTFTIWGKEDRPSNRTIEFVSEVLSETPKKRKYMDDPSKPSTYVSLVSSGHMGRVSRLWKVIKEDGVEVSRELVSKDTYRMSEDIYVRGTATPAPAPAPTAAPVEESTQASSEESVSETTPETQAPPQGIDGGPAFDPNLNPGG